MDEIKFRAWDAKNKEMVFLSLRFLVEYFNRENVSFGDGNFNSYEWMQFTGLQDKNKNDIYVGDLLKIAMTVGSKKPEYIWRVVEFKDGTFSAWGLLITHANRSEVVGNIYQNPELL